MHRRLITFLPVLTLVILVADCKKSSPRSSTKSINSFTLQASVNSYLPKDIVCIIVGAVYSGACIIDGSGVAFHPTASGDHQ
jgi:hypothetical protein